jgi:hypothetical protein
LIIYVIGVLFGLFPKDPELIRFAVVALLSIASGGLMLAAFAYRGRRRGTLAFLLSSTLLALFLIFGGLWFGIPKTPVHWATLVLGALLFLASALDIWSLVRAHRSSKAAPDRPPARGPHQFPTQKSDTSHSRPGGA